MKPYPIEIRLARGEFWLLVLTRDTETDIQKSIIDQRPLTFYRDGRWQKEQLITNYRFPRL